MGFFKKFTNKLAAPQTTVQLKLSDYSVCLGENLQGTVNGASREDFDTTETHCEILSTEQARVLKQVYALALRTSIPKVGSHCINKGHRPPLKQLEKKNVKALSYSSSSQSSQSQSSQSSSSSSKPKRVFTILMT